MSNYIEHSNIRSFFADRIEKAAETLNIILDKMASAYITDLLADYINNSTILDPVGIDILQSFHETPGIRLSKLKKIGDRCLMIAGGFPAHLSKKPVKIDYYIKIGHIGYGNAAIIIRDHYRDEHFQKLFEMLDNNLEIYRDVVEKAVGLCYPIFKK